MELFLPSIIVLIIAGCMTFFIIPNIPQSVIVLLITVLCIGVIIMHKRTFSDEYKYTMFRDIISSNGYAIIISLLSIGIFILSINLWYIKPKSGFTPMKI